MSRDVIDVTEELVRRGRRRLATQAAHSVRSKPLEWLWPGYLPAGKIVDAYGDGDMGKSLVLLDIAARVSKGFVMPDGSPGVQGPIVIFAAEDDAADTIVPRLVAAHADLSQCEIVEGEIHCPDGTTDWLGLREDFDTVAELFRDLRPRLAVFDPILAFLGHTKSGIDAEVRAALGPLKNLATECNTTILSLRHINKSAGSAANMRGTASTAFRNLARAGLVFGQHPDDEDRRVMAPNKNNLSDRAPSLGYRLVGVDVQHQQQTLPAARVDWLGPVPFTPGEILGGEPEGLRKGSKTEEGALRLRELLEEGPQPASTVQAILEAEGFPLRTLMRSKAGMKIASVKHSDGWYWSLED